MISSRELRTKFFEFFKERGHTVVTSSSLIPAQDPTLLFANAGMNQFKDAFLGKEKRSYTRAVSIQKCIRAGGKHNDLENVGFTKRHLTFFEMMGNFSFGDYFKRDAIIFAWDFLTKVVGLPADKLYATVFYQDEEAYALWQTAVGLPAERVVKLGAADNFWQMGDTGPCGPCTEIYIDRGGEHGCGGQECAPGCSCDRFMEIWNLVFMQFDRQPDGTDVLLKQTGVDTGMGLERLTAVVQHKDSVFETDIFAPLIAAIERLTGINYATASVQQQAAFRVIVDHIRSSSCAIADGAMPSNEGRGYVIRKIIRRAALFAQKLSPSLQLADVAQALIDSMGDLYPELVARGAIIKTILTQELEKFSANLVQGQVFLAKYMAETKGKNISGDQAFKLYDTYGFPLELTNVIAHEHGYTVDSVGFEKLMENQRIQSGKKMKAVTLDTALLPEDVRTQFTGYDELQTSAKIIALFDENNILVEALNAGQKAWLVAEQTPFYIECGGQVTDKGTLVINNKSTALLDLKKVGNARAMLVELPSSIALGDTITMHVDTSFRFDTMKNHTATHLLQGALMRILGEGVKQAGSLVTADYLRFDFSYHANITPEQIKQIEELVNQKIMENTPTCITQTTYKDAIARGVIAFFGEKYNPENVRVVEIPGFSAELCGGTHVRATGDIGCFKITENTALSAGNRRFVAVTGPKAVQLFQETFGIVKNLSQEFKVPLADVSGAIAKLSGQYKDALASIKDLKKQLIAGSKEQWLGQREIVNSVPFLFLEIPNTSVQELKDIAQDLAKQDGLYFLYSVADNRVVFVALASASLASRINFKEFAQFLKDKHGMQSGGSGNSIQGGGMSITPALKDAIKQWLSK